MIITDGKEATIKNGFFGQARTDILALIRERTVSLLEFGARPVRSVNVAIQLVNAGSATVVRDVRSRRGTSLRSHVLRTTKILIDGCRGVGFGRRRDRRRLGLAEKPMAWGRHHDHDRRGKGTEGDHYSCACVPHHSTRGGKSEGGKPKEPNEKEIRNKRGSGKHVLTVMRWSLAMEPDTRGSC
jgi:hypothetical protein